MSTGHNHPAAIAAVFDDAHGQLSPLDDLRPRSEIRSGGLTTRQRLVGVLGLQLGALFVGKHTEALAREECPGLAVNELPAEFDRQPIVMLNSRLSVPGPLVGALCRGELGSGANATLVEDATGHVVAARLDAAAARVLAQTGAPVGEVQRLPGVVLMSRPWHIRHFRDACIATDLALVQRGRQRLGAEACTPGGRLAGCTVIGHHPLTIDESAKVYPGVVFDCENGAVYIGPHTTIRPACTLIGPVIIGSHCHVLDRAVIKANTATGDHCKLAGEVGGTIFQGFANKAHDGHLGDSYVGAWANLGAGTTNSNLLNTYGDVPMKVFPESSSERTGHQFMGCIIGDHCKLAICTRIMTGTILHTGIMFAQSLPAAGSLPRFGWVTDANPPGTKFFRADKFMEIADSVIARRKMTMGHAYRAKLLSLLAGASKRND